MRKNGKLSLIERDTRGERIARFVARYIFSSFSLFECVWYVYAPFSFHQSRPPFLRYRYKAGYYHGGAGPEVHHVYVAPPPPPPPPPVFKYVEYVEKPVYLERIVERPVFKSHPPLPEFEPSWSHPAEPSPVYGYTYIYTIHTFFHIQFLLQMLNFDNLSFQTEQLVIRQRNLLRGRPQAGRVLPLTFNIIIYYINRAKQAFSLLNIVETQ